VSAEIVAGVDCSTQSTKIAVVEAESGRVVCVTHALHTVTGVGGARETDPQNWFDALRTALTATGLTSRISAISIAAQQHGLVVLGDNRRPIRPAVLWNDTRSALDSLRLIEALGGPERASSLIGSIPGPAFTVSSWAWLRRVEPEAAAATVAVRLPHDWMTEQLTGEAVTDRGDVSATGWWSTATAAYLPEVLNLPLVRLSESMLPRVLGPNCSAGPLTAEAAEALGLRAGIPVGPGTGDNPAAALGIGAEPGIPVMSLGTSGTAYTVSTRHVHDPSGTVVGLADASGLYLPLACTLNCTQAVDRIAGWLGLERDMFAPDAGGVVVLPFFDGERTPNLPFAAASIVGLRHTTEPAQILRAAYEGAVASLLVALDHIDGHSSGIPSDAPIALVGGGARGAGWQQCVASLSGRNVRTIPVPEPVAVGAAAQAAAILTGRSVGEVARSWAPTGVTELVSQGRDVDAIERIQQVEASLGLLNGRMS
jgi:xylulokinase